MRTDEDYYMLALDKIILCEFVMLMSKVGSIESSIEILA